MNKENQIVTDHKLDFTAAEWWLDPNIKLFRIGSCSGQWSSTPDAYYIISVINADPGNGHLNDVFQWFEHSCARDNKNLIIMEIMNERFYLHCLSKRKFIPLDDKGSHLIKVFNDKAHKKLLKKGNHFFRKEGKSLISI